MNVNMINENIQRLDEYYKQKEKDGPTLLNHLIKVSKESINQADSDKALKNVIFGEWNHAKSDSGENLHVHNPFPVTTIVGNPNSHKRNFALARAFSFLHNKPDDKNRNVLIVLLNKNPEEMRKKMICPALASKFMNLNPASSDKTYEYNFKLCSKCYTNVSFLNVNPGCITPEEFLAMLKDHILLYTGYHMGTDYIKRNRHFRDLLIIFDDYHRIDFNYPFLSSSNLFASALINLCQSYKVGLTILCDKSSKRVREICTLSDYVMCIEREESQTDGLILYTERNGDDVHTSSIYKYCLNNLRTLFMCESSNFKFSKNHHMTFNEIASMKEYWRETINTITLTDSSEKAYQKEKC